MLLIWHTIRRMRKLAGSGTLLCRGFDVYVGTVLNIVVVAESIWHKPYIEKRQF